MQLHNDAQYTFHLLIFSTIRQVRTLQEYFPKDFPGRLAMSILDEAAATAETYVPLVIRTLAKDHGLGELKGPIGSHEPLAFSLQGALELKLLRHWSGEPCDAGRPQAVESLGPGHWWRSGDQGQECGPQLHGAGYGLQLSSPSIADTVPDARCFVQVGLQTILQCRAKFTLVVYRCIVLFSMLAEPLVCVHTQLCLGGHLRSDSDLTSRMRNLCLGCSPLRWFDIQDREMEAAVVTPTTTRNSDTCRFRCFVCAGGHLKDQLCGGHADRGKVALKQTSQSMSTHPMHFMTTYDENLLDLLC